jgi:CHAT domain-containing protein
LKLHLGDGTPVILMPPAELGQLPLHAAWCKVGGVKHAFLDYYTVSYAPSAFALHVSYRRVHDPRRDMPTLMAVVNPTADLRYALSEGESVAEFFAPAARRILVEHAATEEAVVREASGRTYLHFACHGFHDRESSMRSGLVLADDEPLTLADIISKLDLRAARLVTLSACETGLTDLLRSPEEFIGLPAGFLQAGAPAVVSTLWPVSDRATSLLMEQFYFKHLQKGLHPSKALRSAQRWLRDSTREELCQYYESSDRVSARDARAARAELVVGGPPDDRPYANPYFWAAFTFTGA